MRKSIWKEFCLDYFSSKLQILNTGCLRLTWVKKVELPETWSGGGHKIGMGIGETNQIIPQTTLHTIT